MLFSHPLHSALFLKQNVIPLVAVSISKFSDSVLILY